MQNSANLGLHFAESWQRSSARFICCMYIKRIVLNPPQNYFRTFIRVLPTHWAWRRKIIKSTYHEIKWKRSRPDWSEVQKLQTYQTDRGNWLKIIIPQPIKSKYTPQPYFANLFENKIFFTNCIRFISNLNKIELWYYPSRKSPIKILNWYHIWTSRIYI